MALDNKELITLRELIELRGLRSAMQTGNAIEVEKIRPKLGEMVYNETDLFIGIGNGVKNTNETPYRLTGNYPTMFSSNIYLIRNIWRNLNRYLIIGQVETIILPPLLHELFEKNKPDNFSFLRGEPLTIDSPFFEEWLASPDSRGCFLRQQDRRVSSEGRDKDSWVSIMEGSALEPRHLGSYQRDSFKSHSHTINPSNVVNNYTADYVRSETGWVTGKIDFVAEWSQLPNSLLEIGEGMGEETRPNNFCVLYVWKTYDETMKIIEENNE